MASITFGNTSTRPYCVFTVTQSSQSVSNNQTTISYSLVLKRPYNIESSATKYWSCTINGVTHNGSGAIGGSGDKTLLSGTQVISHNSDGSKSISFSASIGLNVTWGGVYVGTISGSGSMTLSNIPRSSSFGSISGNTIGSEMIVNINRNSSSFTHQLYYKVGNSDWYDLGGGIGTSKTFNIDINTCWQYPSSTTGVLQLLLRTYNGNTQIGGDVYKNVDVDLPSNINPGISSISISEATYNLANAFGVYIKDKSQLNVAVNASGSYGSSISSYSTSINGITYNSQSFTSSTIRSSGTVTITSTVTDSRGRTASRSQNISVVDYFSPAPLKFTVDRCTGDGTLSDEGTYVKCVYSFSIAPVSNKNGKLAKIQWLNNGNWTDLMSYSLGYSASDSQVVFTQSFSSDNEFKFRLYVADYFSESTLEKTLGTAFTLMNFNASGRGVGIGKVSTKNAFEVGLPADFSGDVNFNNTVSIGNTNLGTFISNTDTSISNLNSSVGSLNGSVNGLNTTTSSLSGSVGGLTTTVNGLTNFKNAVADYVVEQGDAVAGGVTWHYRKWNSGMAECWGYCGVTISTTTKWGSMYYQETRIGGYDLPFAFAQTAARHPRGTITLYDDGGNFFINYANGWHDNKSPKAYAISPVSKSGVSCTLFTYVVGYWK